MNERKPFLLLDPPAIGHFQRRNALREKEGAAAAVFPSIDLILHSGAVRDAGLAPRFIDAQINGLSWDDVGRLMVELQPRGVLSLLSSTRAESELVSLREATGEVPGMQTYVVAPLALLRQPHRLDSLIADHAWLTGVVLNSAENNLKELLTGFGSRVTEGVNILQPQRGGGRSLTPLVLQESPKRRPPAMGVTGMKIRSPGRPEHAEDSGEPAANRTSSVAGVDEGSHAKTRSGLEDDHRWRLQVSAGEGLHIPRPEHSLFRDRRYRFPQSKRGPVTCVQFSFGCPFTCEFCLDNQLYRRALYRDVGDVLDELAEIDRLGFREVYFKDLTFGLNRRRTEELLQGMIDRRLKVRWLCTTRVDVMNRDLLRLMRTAGCYGIEFGVEHARTEVRHRVDKRITEERIREVFRWCRELGIETTGFFMLAFEDDTEEDVRATIQFARSLQPDYASFNVVNALPGTPFEERAAREGFLREQVSDLTFRSSNIRYRHLTDDRVAALHEEAVRSFYLDPRGLVRRITRIRSLFEVRKLIGLGWEMAWGRSGRQGTAGDRAKSKVRPTVGSPVVELGSSRGP